MNRPQDGLRNTLLNTFPAHAGMNRLKIYALRMALNVSRTRGDEPHTDMVSLAKQVRFPHTRG